MLKILKSSVRDTFIYSIGTFSTKLAGFILVPLYTNSRYLPEEDYGILNLVEANLQVIISVFGLGLCYAYERWYWDKEFIVKRRSIFFSVLMVTLGIALLLVAGLFPFSTTISQLLFGSSLYAGIFRLMVVNAGLEIIAQTPNSLIRLSERPSLYTIANMSKLFVSILLTVLFVVKWDLGLYGVYYAQLLGVGVYFLILSKFIYNHLEIRFELNVLTQMIRFRFPFLLPVIALNVFNFNDRFVLSNTNGLVEAGIYSLGAKLANTIKVFLITAIWLALTPTIYKMMDDPNNKRFYSKIMTYLGFTVIMFVMLFSFFSKELVSFFATEKIYEEAYKVIPLISLGIFFGLLKDISLISLNITKKTASVAVTTIVVTLFNLGMNILLVPFIGMIGAAVSSLLSQFIFFIIIHTVAQKYYRIPYEMWKITLMVILSVILFAISTLSNPLSVWVRLPLKCLLICSFPFLLYLFGFYEQVEIVNIKGFWNKWKNPLTWRKNIGTLKF